jgi:hypothetical protein
MNDYPEAVPVAWLPWCQRAPMNRSRTVPGPWTTHLPNVALVAMSQLAEHRLGDTYSGDVDGRCHAT